MKTIILVLVLVAAFVSGCASEIIYNPDESCAFQDMALKGISTGQGSAFVWGRPGVAFSSSYDIQCGVPQNEREECKVNGVRDQLQPKLEYNEHITSKKFVTFLGYCAGIVPGVVAKILYDKQQNAALEEAHQRWLKDRSACLMSPDKRVPASSQ